MPSADKVAAVAEITDRFTGAGSVVLTEYRGLSVAQVARLRTSLGDHARFRVVKNTLTKIAVDQAGLTDEIGSLLTGPSAITFITGDVVEAAKSLRDFARDNPALVIKGGVMDGRPLGPAEIVKLAELEPREVLLAKLAGAMTASATRAAGAFDALPTRVAQLVEALRAKREAEQGAQPAATLAEAEEPAAPQDGEPAQDEEG